MPNNPEGAPERFPTREEVLSIIEKYAVNPTVTIEASDENGEYYYIETSSHDGEDKTVSHVYMKKGNHGIKMFSGTSGISAIYYDGGFPVGGKEIGIFDPVTGEWIGS